ncbi:MAG: hypothetical protein GXO04_02080 [Aquificae bacterium]|nr:hypothetical protein [Aquificota bacterium]
MLREKIKEIKERLKDPFGVEGLEEELKQLTKLIKKADTDELLLVLSEYEEIKKLVARNIFILKKIYGVE